MTWSIQVEDHGRWRTVMTDPLMSREDAVELQERLRRYYPERQFRLAALKTGIKVRGE